MPLMNNTPVVIGRVRISKSLEVTETFECAAWFRKVKIQPGIYDLVCYPYAPEASVGHTLYATVPGVVTDACFQSRIGAHYGDPNRGKEEIGNKTETHFKLGTYGKIGDDLWEGKGDVQVRFNPAVVDLFTYDVKASAHTEAYTGWSLRYRPISAEVK